MGICQRQGLGKLRHVDTRALWLQQKVRRGEVELRKVKGTENPADLFTKHLSSPKVVGGLLKVFGCEYREGRPEGAPELRRGQGTQAGTLLSLLEQGYRRGRRQDELWLAEGAEGHGEGLVTTETWATCSQRPAAKSWVSSSSPRLGLTTKEDCLTWLRETWTPCSQGQLRAKTQGTKILHRTTRWSGEV